MDLRSEQEAQDIWKSLVVTLGLPLEWQSIRATIIPLELDQPIGGASEICSKKDKTKSFELDAIEAELSSATSRATAARDGLRPDLKLAGSFSVNGVDADAQIAQREILKRDNPSWAVGLTLSMSLGMEQARSDAQRAAVRQAQVQAQATALRDEHVLRWQSLCDGLARLQRNEDLYAKINQQQAERARREEQRYALGRASVLAFIQSQDDATAAELEYNRARVEIRRQAWAVLRQDRAIFSKLSSALASSSARRPQN
jgi:hypothetical protein